MIDIAAIVLPQPDSPTTPSVSPAASSKLSPSTARTVELRRRMWVRRSDTSSSGAVIRASALLQPHVEGVLQGVPDEVERHDGEDDHDQRGVDLPPVAGLKIGGAV